MPLVYYSGVIVYCGGNKVYHSKLVVYFLCTNVFFILEHFVYL